MPIRIVSYSPDMAKNANRRTRSIYAVNGNLADLKPSVDYALSNVQGATFQRFYTMGRSDDQYIFRDGIVRVRNLKQACSMVHRPEFVEVRPDKVIPYNSQDVKEWLASPKKSYWKHDVFRLLDHESVYRYGTSTTPILATGDELAEVRRTMSDRRYPHLLDGDNTLSTHSVGGYLLTQDERLWRFRTYEKRPWELYPAEEKEPDIYNEGIYDSDTAKAVFAKYAHLTGA